MSLGDKPRPRATAIGRTSREAFTLTDAKLIAGDLEERSVILDREAHLCRSMAAAIRAHAGRVGRKPDGNAR